MYFVQNFEKRFQQVALKCYPAKEKESVVQTKKKLKGHNGSHGKLKIFPNKYGIYSNCDNIICKLTFEMLCY